jgi:hypothetical protein
MLLSCRAEPDAARYYRLTTGDGDPAARIEECAGLHSETMQSDCQLTVASQSAAMAGLCAELAESVWRSECYVMAAERLRESDPEQAGALCQQAEHFHNQCIQHLWQRELMALTRHGSRAFPARLPAATALYARWSALSSDSDMEVRFWRLFYIGGFQRSRFLSPSHCAPLPGVHQERCREAAAAHYTRQLRHVAGIPRALSVLCALSPVTSEAAARTRVPELSAEPAPELDAVLVTVHDQLCEGSAPRPDAAEIPLLLPGFDEE